MTTIGDRIRELRDLRNMTQQQLADGMGESSGRVIYNWEKGISRPDSDKIVKLCSVLRVSADELLGCKSESPKPTVAEWNKIVQYRALDDHGKEVVDAVLDLEHARCLETKRQKTRMFALDLYRLPASAGTGSFLDSEDKETAYIPATALAEEADYMLEVRGDSMEPTFFDGDRILVKKQDTVSPGEIGIFVVNGEVFVKELGNNKLISHNAAYKPITIQPFDSVYCCGKVLGAV